MEALEFLKEAQRMCKKHHCVECPVGKYINHSEDKLEEIVSEVEQWSKEHSIITNAQKFKEVFGEKTIDQLALCETRTVGPNVPKLFTKPSSWWDKPYKEPEHE